MPPPRAKPSWVAVGGLVLLLAAGGGWFVWRMRLEAIDRALEGKRAALKTLHLSGRLPPNREVVEYLKGRSAALEAQYQTGVSQATVSAALRQGQHDPQLYFQQRVHEVQRTLERLSAARGMKTPEQLGLPKELPPVDVVPRLLLQLELIQDASDLVVAQGISQLVSVKVEDPETVAAPGEDRESFLMRLPVRLRLNCSLETLVKVLGVLDRAKPMVGLQALRLRQPSDAAD
ncbi:MAG: hypothetical protein HYZ95_00545, partial [Candidatus Omnitrophica bacterium]|nr:hypothetical protein [Candidatus Omnitrophota bacterium]